MFSLLPLFASVTGNWRTHKLVCFCCIIMRTWHQPSHKVALAGVIMTVTGTISTYVLALH